jgi:hypothetical protein
MNGNPHEVHLFEDDPKRFDSPFEKRRICDVENVAFIRQQTAGQEGFLSAPFAQAYICPSCETVLFVPYALAMTDEYEFFHGNPEMAKNISTRGRDPTCFFRNAP